jgi:penicillin-binding protein-related factor A (putative recombinase)
MREATLYPVVKDWIRNNVKHTCVIELKIAKSKSLPYSEVKEHQEANLFAAKNRVLMYKIPDVGFDQKPFDICVWSGCKAYVGIVFYEPRKLKTLYMINIDSWKRYRAKADKKSITIEECSSLAEYEVEL